MAKLEEKNPSRGMIAEPVRRKATATQ